MSDGIKDTKKDYKLENGIKTGKYYPNNGRMVYAKPEEEVKVTSTVLKDFYVIDNGVRRDIYYFEFENGVKSKGTYNKVVNDLMYHTLNGTGNIGKDFISSIIFHNHDRVKYEINGGYTRLDDIEVYEPTKLEKANIETNIIQFISNNFSTELKVAFKLLLILPFHWIIKTDPNTVNRGLVKGLSLYGVANAGKSLICLIVLNIFNSELITTPNSYSTVAGFKNDIVNHVGIILADDCNDLFNKDNSKRMDDLNKNIINTEVPSKTMSDGETVNHDSYSSTPVYTSNDQPDFKTATLDRIDVINVLESRDIPVFKFGENKHLLLKLGKILAYTFKMNYKDIVETGDSLKASNLLLERAPLDFTDIIEAECNINPKTDYIPLNILFRQYINKKSNFELSDANIEDEIKKVIKNEKFYYESRKDDEGFLINRSEFFKFFRDLTDDSGRDLKGELKTLKMKRTTRRNNGKVENVHLIRYNDLLNWLKITD